MILNLPCPARDSQPDLEPESRDWGTTAAIVADTLTGSRKQSGLSHDCKSSPARLHTTTAGHYFFRFMIADL
jgi:hypothetical protein